MFDRLALDQLEVVHNLLASMMDPVSVKLTTAPLVTDRRTDDERQSVARGAASIKRNGGVNIDEASIHPGSDLGISANPDQRSKMVIAWSTEARDELVAMDHPSAARVLRCLRRFVAKGEGWIERVDSRESFPFLLAIDSYWIALDSPDTNRLEVAAILDRRPPPAAASQKEKASHGLRALLSHLPATRFLRASLLGLLMGLFAVYFLTIAAGGLSSWFSDDDIMNMHHYWSEPTSTLVKANVFFFSGESRPLGGLYYTAIHWLWGMNPLPYRLGAFVLVSLNIVLLFFIVKELSGSLEISVLAVLLVGVNTSFISLYYDTGMIYDVLAFSFYYAAFYYYLRFRKQGQRIRLRSAFLFLGLVVAALNSKEISVSLPIALLGYEFFWNPPSKYSFKCLVQWVKGVCSLAWIASGMTVAFLFGVLKLSSLTESVGYKPVPSLWMFLERSAWYFRILTFESLRPSPTGMFGILAGMAVLTALLRKRLLLFAAVTGVIAFLPMAFIPPRGAFAVYVPSVFWALWIAGALAELRKLGVSLIKTSRMEDRVRWSSQLVLCALVLMLVIPSNLKAFGYHENAIQNVQYRNRGLYDDLLRLRPQIPRGAKVLVLHDPWPELGFEAAMFMQLAYNDPTLFIRSAAVARHNGDNPNSFNVKVDYVDGHFQLVK